MKRLDTSKAILIAAILLAVAMLFSGRYEFGEKHASGIGIYRLDRLTGQVTLCQKAGPFGIHCSDQRIAR
jgi:hypothetical protein